MLILSDIARPGFNGAGVDIIIGGGDGGTKNNDNLL